MNISGSNNCAKTVPVMIVDDEPSIIEAVTIYLEYEGYKVIPASSGYACLQQLRGGFRGVILMDIVM